MATSPTPSGAPRFTFGIPVYNGQATLAETLECCARLPPTDVVVLVADNCSTDATYDIAMDYSRRYPHIQVVRHAKNLGVGNNFKYLLDACRTQYYMWLAADDVIESINLDEVVNLFVQYPEAMAVSPIARVGEVGQQVPDSGNRSLVGEVGTNIRQFLLRPGVNSRFYSVYHTELLRQLYSDTFGSGSWDYFASDIVFSVAILRRGKRWPQAPGFTLLRKPGISADGWKLRQSLAKSWLGAVFPSVRFIRQIVGMVPLAQRPGVLLVASVLYARYLIGPVRHRLAQLVKS